jgi:hypothetical protein
MDSTTMAAPAPTVDTTKKTTTTKTTTKTRKP